MSDFLPPVVATLLGEIGQFKAKMAEAKGEMATVGSSAGKMAVLGKAGLAGLGIAAVAIGYESVKMGTSFQSAMELIHTQAGASQQEVNRLGKSVLDLAPTVGIGPEKLAEGLYHVESAGFRGAEALEILKAAAKTAAIGQSDLESTTQALIGTMAVGFDDVRNAADAGAYLNTIVGIGDMRMGKLAQAISTGVLPSFKSAGLGMKDFGAALATLTDNVTPADEAATRLRMTVALLGAPSHEAFKALTAVGLGATEATKALAHRDELQKYGISVSQLSLDLRKPDGLLVAVMDLKSHLSAAGLTGAQQAAVLQKAFGGGRTSGAIMTLLQESDRLKSKYEELGTSATRQARQQEAWAATQKTFKQQMHELTAQIEVWGVKIGLFLIPKIQTLVTWINDTIRFLKEHKTVLDALLIVISVGVGAMLAPIILFGKAIQELSKHWQGVKSAFSDVVAFFKGLWAGIVGVFSDVAGFFSRMWGSAARATKDAWNDITGFFSRMWNDIAGAVMDGIHKAFDPAIDWVKQRIAEFKDWWKQHSDEIKQIWDELWGGITDVIKAAWDYITTTADAGARAVKAVWRGLVDALSGPAKASFDVLKGIFKAGWNAITGITRTVMDLLKGIFKAAWDAVRGVGRLAMSLLETDFRLFRDVISGVWRLTWQFIGDFLATVWNGILDVLGVFLDLFTGHWGKAWDDAKKFVTDTVGGIVKIIIDFFGNAISLLYKAGRDILTGLWNGIQAVWGLVTNVGYDVAQTMYNMFRDTVNWLWNAGWNLIIGLWNGITATGSWLWKHLEDWGKSIVSTLTKPFRSLSPSKAMFEHGQWLAQGLALGIAADQSKAVGAAKAMANSVLGAGQSRLNLGLNANANLPISVRTGGQPIVVHVDIANAVKLDSKQIQTSQQRRTLRTEARNTNNGLSRYTAR